MDIVEEALTAIRTGPWRLVWARRDLTGVRAQTTGATVRVTFTYGGGKTATFTYNDGKLCRLQSRKK